MADDGPHFFHCHACSWDGSNADQRPDGEWTCSHCNEAGFVELVEQPPVAARSDPGARLASSSGDAAAPQSIARTPPRPAAIMLGGMVPGAYDHGGQYGFELTFDGDESRVATTQTVPPAVRFYRMGPDDNQIVRLLGLGDEQQLLRNGGAPPDLGRLIEVVMNSIGQLMGPLGFDQIVHVIMQNDAARRGTPAASAAAVAALPTRELTAETAGDCAICQEDFAPGDTVHFLSEHPTECPHMFHSTCVIPWLTDHNSCPVCRFELPTDDPEYERRRDEVRDRVRREIAARGGDGVPPSQ